MRKQIRGRKWYCMMMIIGMLSILLTGCWDYRELENRAMIVGLGIDLVPVSPSQEKKQMMYEIILQVIEASSEQQGGQMGGGAKNQGGGQGYTNFVTHADTISEGILNIMTKSDRLPYLAHLQLILLSEKAAKRGIGETFDFLSRFPQMRRQTEIMVVEGPVKSYLQTASQSEPAPALHLAELDDALQHTLKMPVTNLSTVSKGIRSGVPFVLPVLSFNTEKQVIIEKMAVFSPYQMVGWLTEEESTALSFFKNEIENGIIEFPCSTEKKVSIHVIRGNADTKAQWRQEKPHIRYTIKVEGDLIEYHCLGIKLQPNQIQAIERKFAKILEQRLQSTFHRLKNRYHDDLFGLTIRLKNHPKLYKWIRQNPRDFFEAAAIEVKVQLEIQNIGNTMQTLYVK